MKSIYLNEVIFHFFILLFFYFCFPSVSVYKAKDIQDQGTKDYVKLKVFLLRTELVRTRVAVLYRK